MVMAAIAHTRAAARPALDGITERGFEFDEVDDELVGAIFPVLKPKIPRVVPRKQGSWGGDTHLSG
jgi:hypothetical protein